MTPPQSANQAPQQAASPAAQAAPPAFSGTSVDPAIANLQREESSVLDRIRVLTAQRRALHSELTSGDASLKVSAAAKYTDVSLDLASAQANLDRIHALMSVRGMPVADQTGTLAPPSLPAHAPMLDSDQVTGIVIVFMLAVLMPISLGLLRRLWRVAPKQTAQVSPDNISPRLDRLEHAVDAIAIETERISEGQRFITKVLAERPLQASPAASAPPGTASSRDRAADSNAVGDAKPFLALGAGPVEAIRMAERQPMRQSITPH